MAQVGKAGIMLTGLAEIGLALINLQIHTTENKSSLLNAACQPVDIPDVKDSKKKQRKSYMKGQRLRRGHEASMENNVRNLLEREFAPLKFPTVRPKWLLNPKTQRAMELDLYNAHLNISFEYSGRQHYNFVPHIHKTMEVFLEMQERDKLKRQICKDRGVAFVEIPHYEYNDLPTDRDKLRYLLLKIHDAKQR